MYYALNACGSPLSRSALLAQAVPRSGSIPLPSASQGLQSIFDKWAFPHPRHPFQPMPLQSRAFIFQSQGLIKVPEVSQLRFETFPPQYRVSAWKRERRALKIPLCRQLQPTRKEIFPSQRTHTAACKIPACSWHCRIHKEAHCFHVLSLLHKHSNRQYYPTPHSNTEPKSSLIVVLNTRVKQAPGVPKSFLFCLFIQESHKHTRWKGQVCPHPNQSFPSESAPLLTLTHTHKENI